MAFIHELRSLAGSREQIIVVETFKDMSGYSALLLSFLAGADRVIIPEVPYDPEKLAYLVLQDKHQTPANYAVVLVSDGASLEAASMEKYRSLLEERGGAEAIAATMPINQVNDGKKLISSGVVAAELLGYISGEEVFTQTLTYLLRTGSPDGQDLLGASNFAFIAARLLSDEKYGRMTAFTQENMWTDVDLKFAMEGVRKIDLENWYNIDTYRPNISVIWSV